MKTNLLINSVLGLGLTFVVGIIGCNPDFTINANRNCEPRSNQEEGASGSVSDSSSTGSGGSGGSTAEIPCLSCGEALTDISLFTIPSPIPHVEKVCQEEQLLFTKVLLCSCKSNIGCSKDICESGMTSKDWSDPDSTCNNCALTIDCNYPCVDLIQECLKSNSDSSKDPR